MKFLIISIITLKKNEAKNCSKNLLDPSSEVKSPYTDHML